MLERFYPKEYLDSTYMIDFEKLYNTFNYLTSFNGISLPLGMLLQQLLNHQRSF